MTQLSPHFTLEEMVFSEIALRRGLNNEPTESVVANLKRLCVDVLEPIRVLLGVPLHVNSGYRSIVVNEAVGSTSKHSAHIDGRAADIVPVGLDSKEAFDRIRLESNGFDQVLFECNAWIHVAIPIIGFAPRHEALLASGGPGDWTYSVVV